MSDIATRLRQTRANMIGTDDEDHYWDCQLAAGRIDALRAENEKLRERLEKAHSFISRADWMQFFEEEQEGDND